MARYLRWFFDLDAKIGVCALAPEAGLVKKNPSNEEQLASYEVIETGEHRPERGRVLVRETGQYPQAR